MKLRHTWVATVATALLLMNLAAPFAQAEASEPEKKPELPAAEDLQKSVVWGEGKASAPVETAEKGKGRDLFKSKAQKGLVANQQTLSFSDEDEQPNYIGGTLQWNAAADESRVTGYAVYTLDERNNKLSRLGTVPKNALGYQFSINHLRPHSNAVKLGVYAMTGSVLSTTPLTTRLWDYPRFMARHVKFSDNDYDQGEISGVVVWDKADSEQGIAGYDVFLFGDDSPPQYLGSADKGKPCEISVSWTKIPEGAYEIVVLPRSADDNWAVDAWYPCFLLDRMYDDTRLPQVDLPAPTNVQFEDLGRTNDDILQYTGQLTWQPPADEAGQIQSYRLYLEDEEGQRVKTIGEVSAKVPYVNFYHLWVETLGSRLAVYACSAEGEAETGGNVFLWDRPSYLQRAVADRYVDLDASTGKIGGPFTIHAYHAWAYGVRSYDISFIGKDGIPVSIGQVPINREDYDYVLDIPYGTPIPPGAQELALTPVNGDGEWGPEYFPVPLIDLKENGTLPLLDQKVNVVNNYGRADTVTIYDLHEGDEVKVYQQEKNSRVLGSGTVPKGQTSVTVSASQLGMGGDVIWVSLRGKGKTESPRTLVAVPDQMAPAPAAVVARNITVINNPTGQPDLVEVRGLKDSYAVRVYGSATGEDLLGQAFYDVEKGLASIAPDQIGAKKGTVYVALGGDQITESKRTAVSFTGEKSEPLQSGQAEVKNMPSYSYDQLVVTNLAAGDVVKVYKEETSTSAAVTSSAVSSQKTTASVSLNALRLSPAGGNLWVSVVRSGQTESERLLVSYGVEASPTLSTSVISVTNSKGDNDQLVVSGLTAGDVVTVYDAATAGNVLGSAIVAEKGTTATVSPLQLKAAGSTVYITVKKQDRAESARLSKSYAAEPRR